MSAPPCPAPFVVVGSSHSGTTTLRDCLSRHPDIDIPKRLEPRFFAFEGDPMGYRGPGDSLLDERVVTSRERFIELYDRRPGRVRGDISPAYLSSERAVVSISENWPGARIVAVLRNPVERAVSSFRLQLLDGLETVPDLESALAAEAARRAAGWSYVWEYRRRGSYAEHLQRYLDTFGPDAVRVYLYEDWQARRGAALLDDLLEFLGMAPSALVTGRSLGSTAPTVRRSQPATSLGTSLRKMFSTTCASTIDLTWKL